MQKGRKKQNKKQNKSITKNDTIKSEEYLEDTFDANSSVFKNCITKLRGHYVSFLFRLLNIEILLTQLANFFLKKEITKIQEIVAALEMNISDTFQIYSNIREKEIRYWSILGHTWKYLIITLSV